MIQSVAFIIHIAVVIFWVAVIIQVTVIYGQYGVSSYKIWRVTVSITVIHGDRHAVILIQELVSIVTLEAIMIHVWLSSFLVQLSSCPFGPLISHY